MTTKPSRKIGLLPFYLKLYDDIRPEYRSAFDSFIQEIVGEFTAHGIMAEVGSVCRVASEFEAAVRQFEATGVDCIVTLHLAYSPSLEAIDVLCRTSLPIILLDTTMDRDFGFAAAPERIMYNHGVHGVMDLASMLCRRKRSFEIVAGHFSDETMVRCVIARIQGAAAVRQFRNSRVLRVGEAFAGMGDFAVSEKLLYDRFGIEIQQVMLNVLDRAVSVVTDGDIAAEITTDCERYQCDLPAEVHRHSVRVGLGLRRLLEEGCYCGMSVNFQAFDRTDRPADTIPFLEIAKAMARGIGYAGEGDVLTAALVGALAQIFDAVTFTEIFCPDWAGNTLFLSHMGEVSPTIAADNVCIFAKPALDGASRDTAVLTCAVKPGPAVLVNLAPGPDDSFTLIAAPVEVLAENAKVSPSMRKTIRTWIRPPCKIGDFLECYSQAGGTHHSALVLGNHTEAITAFGRLCGLRTVCIGGNLNPKQAS